MLNQRKDYLGSRVALTSLEDIIWLESKDFERREKEGWLSQVFTNDQFLASANLEPAALDYG